MHQPPAHLLTYPLPHHAYLLAAIHLDPIERRRWPREVRLFCSQRQRKRILVRIFLFTVFFMLVAIANRVVLSYLRQLPCHVVFRAQALPPLL